MYAEDGSGQQENLTDSSLTEFRHRYLDNSIAKQDVFHYIYAILHHPRYRERYAANLKRSLPRVPFVPDFWAFARAGQRLMDLHINYEQQAEYKLRRVEMPGKKLDWRTTRMRITRDRQGVVYNDFLVLADLPSEVFEYKLGNRSAIEWIVDQYQVSTDKRSGVTNDPNRPEDPQYIVRLIGRVVTVSVETVKIVNALPALTSDDVVVVERLGPAKARPRMKPVAKASESTSAAAKARRDAPSPPKSGRRR